MLRRNNFKMRKRAIHHDPLYIFTAGFVLSSLFFVLISYLQPSNFSASTKRVDFESIDAGLSDQKLSPLFFDNIIQEQKNEPPSGGKNCIFSFLCFSNFWPSILWTSSSENVATTDYSQMHAVYFNSRTLLSEEEISSGDNGSCSDPDVWGQKTYPPELVRNWSLAAQRFFIPFYILGTLYSFVALAIICDEFFVASLEVIIEKTELSEDVAGATFMAAGGSAPELFTSLIGMLFSSEVDVGIGTIIGSAVFNVLFVIAVCAFGSPTTLSLTWWPLCRDTFFYSVGLAMIIVSFLNSAIEIWEPFILFSWYIAYCTFMAFNEKIELFVKENLSCAACGKLCQGDADDVMDMKAIQQEAGLRDQKGRRKTICISTALAIPVGIAGAATGIGEKNQMNGTTGNPNLPPTIMENGESEMNDSMDQKKSEENFGGNSGEEDEEDDGAVTLAWPSEKPWYRKILYLCLLPIMIPLVLTVPDPKRGKPGTKSANSPFAFWGYNLYILSFIMSIVWIAIWSYLMVWWVERIGWLCCIPSVIMGLTFLAAGTSVPDLITSYLVAKKGFGDMALSSSIGSNLFDICVGLPIPWLIYVVLNSFGEGAKLSADNYFAIAVTSDGMFCYILMLFSMLMFIFILIMSMRWKLNKAMGGVMLVLYVLFLVFAILIGFKYINCNIL